MIFPSLPTDNLYKFFSIQGLIAIVIIAFATAKHAIEMDERQILLKSQIDKRNRLIASHDGSWLKIKEEFLALCATYQLQCAIEPNKLTYNLGTTQQRPR